MNTTQRVKCELYSEYSRQVLYVGENVHMSKRVNSKDGEVGLALAQVVQRMRELLAVGDEKVDVRPLAQQLALAHLGEFANGLPWDGHEKLVMRALQPQSLHRKTENARQKINETELTKLSRVEGVKSTVAIFEFSLLIRDQFLMREIDIF